MNPLVSVIIPVYNVKPYLREALDSVIGQTYKRIEIIIVDDGSTDGSESVCDEYTLDPRVTVIHQANGGLSNARNVGLDIHKGDYLCFLDSDDVYHPAFIEKMLDKAQSTCAEMVVCRYAEQSAIGKFDTNASDSMMSRPCLVSGIYNKVDALRSLVEGELNDSVWNKFYNGKLWKNVRFSDGHNYEDTDAMYRVVNECHTISMVDEVLYFYRNRSDSITHNYSVKNTRDWILACSHLETFILSHHPQVFDDDLVEQYEQRSLKEFMGIFANCSRDRALLDELREIIMKKGMRIKQWKVRTRVAYLVVCYVPSLFRYIYTVYLPCRRFIWKVIGR